MTHGEEHRTPINQPARERADDGKLNLATHHSFQILRNRM